MLSHDSLNPFPDVLASVVKTTYNSLDVGVTGLGKVDPQVCDSFGESSFGPS